LHSGNGLHYAISVRPITVLPFLLCFAVQASAAQTHPNQKAESDRLGMTCAQILAMTSMDWVAHFNEQISEKTGSEKKTSPEITIRALAAYSQCYDARTNRLAASLGNSGKGPLMGARGNFRDFEQALNEFTAKAFAATDPPADAVKRAYVSLYEKQFRYDFYRSYAEQTQKTPVQPAKTSAANSPATTTPPAAADDADPFTNAKNRFGELLNSLSDEKLREIHKAFGGIFSGGPVSNDTKLAVYHYAIFCLEPSSATPFSPPPF
jgi:hypothetical protein